MSVVALLNVDVKNNPAVFDAPYEFEITFECLEQLQKDLEWKLTYVGSATSSEYDQELDSVLVGPIPVGVNKFLFRADPPDLSRIPNSEILGVTVILLSCSYDNREFVRVGYYVNNEYIDQEMADNPPAKPIVDKVKRNILAEKPRVTRFAIKWDSEASAPPEFPPEQPEADLNADGDEYGAEEEEEELEEEAEGAEGEDADMEGAEDTAAVADDAVSEAGSEDIEESSEDEDEDEEAEEEGGDDMEMDEPADGNNTVPTKGQAAPAADVMVH